MKRFKLVPHSTIKANPAFASHSYHGKDRVLNIICFFETVSSFTNDHRKSRYFVSKSVKQLTQMGSNKAAALILNGEYEPTDMIVEINKRDINQYRHPRKVLLKPLSTLYKEYLTENSESLPRSLSLDFFKSCLPFYITKADCREIQYCVCGLCENSHNLYCVLKQMLPASDYPDYFPDHLSDFVSRHLVCSNPVEAEPSQWIDWCCILRTCDHCREHLQKTVMLIWSLLPPDTLETPKYIRFGKGFNEKYPDKAGVCFSEQGIFEYMTFFEEEMQKYLFHMNLLRWTKFHHQTVWLGNKDFCYMVMDFSENPTQTFLYESQPMYYGKVSITLHNTIVSEWDEESGDFSKTYVHHLSDNKKHNASFVNELIGDVLPLLECETKPKAVIMLSDNCSSQYKCVGAFNYMLQWVHEYGIEIVKIYGVAGHGKSEIDSAGGLVKEALRSAAVSNNATFYQASDALSIVKKHFEQYPGKVNRVFHEVEAEDAEAGHDTAEEDIQHENEGEDAPVVETPPGSDSETEEGPLAALENSELFQLKKCDGSSVLHFLHFKKKSIIVSPLVCGCEACVEQRYVECLYRTPYYKITTTNGKGVPLQRTTQDDGISDDGISENFADFSEIQEVVHADDDDDDDDIRNELRRDLVAVGSVVAVATPVTSTKNYWVYECLELNDETFKGLYYKRVKGLTFKKTKQELEDVFHGSVIYPAVVLTPSRKSLFTISAMQDIEINR